MPIIINVGIKAPFTTVIGNCNQPCNALTIVILLPTKNQGNKQINIEPKIK